MAFALGVLASIVAWAVIAWSVVPRLQLSRPNRHPDPTHPLGARHRIKVRNASWFWPIGDLRVDSRLVIAGLDANQPDNRTSLVLPVAEGDVFPSLAAAGVPWRRRPQVDAERTFTFRVAELRGGGVRRLSEQHRVHIGNGDLDALAEALRKGGHGCYIRVSVSATHGLSGLRRTRTLRAAVEDFQTGDFEPGTVRIVSPRRNTVDPSAGEHSETHAQEGEEE